MTTLITLCAVLAALAATFGLLYVTHAAKLADCEAALTRAKLRNERLTGDVARLELAALPTAPVFEILTAQRQRDRDHLAQMEGA